MKNILINKFEVMRMKNPNVTIVNLVAGTLLLVLLAIFSVWYSGDSGGSEGLQNLFNSEQAEEVTQTEPNTVVVLQGEGLWNVAERVCGNGELYNQVALENGLSVWSALETGQQLKVSCNY